MRYLSRRSTKIASVISLPVMVVLLFAIIVPSVASAATPSYPVMNTSEYPPDGVYFRTQPDWSSADRTPGYGVFAGDAVRLNCFDFGSNVPRRDGGPNTIWYRADNVTRPNVAGRANSGWINAHFVNDGTGPNQTAPGVIRCGTTATPPPPTKTAAPALFDLNGTTDNLLFRASMSEFVTKGNAQFHGTKDEKKLKSGDLNWATDGCSNPFFLEPQRSQPGGFDFRNACWRHDFGYRNYKRQGRFNENARQQIDNKLLSDMNAVCNTYYGVNAYKGVTCRNTFARGYYEVVRGCGSSPTKYCATPILRNFRIIA